MSFPTWPPDINNITDSVFKNTILDGQVDVSGTLYNRTGNVIIGDSSNPDFDPSSNGITLNTTRVCLGKDSSVTGDNGIAIGNSAITGLQENSISIGYNSIVDASNSISIGPDASANGLNSIALGYNSGTGSYTNSVALGANSTVGANDVISLGDGTHKVGIGTTIPSEALEISGNILCNKILLDDSSIKLTFYHSEDGSINTIANTTLTRLKFVANNLPTGWTVSQEDGSAYSNRITNNSGLSQNIILNGNISFNTRTGISDGGYLLFTCNVNDSRIMSFQAPERSQSTSITIAYADTISNGHFIEFKVYQNSGESRTIKHDGARKSHIEGFTF